MMGKRFQKRLIAISLLIMFAGGFTIEPASAILENKIKKTHQEPSILDYINFDIWKKKNDPHLEKYIVSAINNNYDIKTAALKLQQAQINVTATRAGQLPVLSLGATPTLNKMPGVTNSEGSIALPIIAQYELDLFLKNRDKTKSAKELLKGSVYQTQATNISIVSLVGTTYYNVVKLDKIIELQKDLVKDRKEIYRLMKLSNAQGLSSTSDLILAEKQYVLAQNDLLDYEKSRQQTLNALAVLIGESPNNTKEFERAALDDLSDNFEIPAEISSDIIINRPDYKSLEYQLKAAGLDVRVAKKEFLPTINIFGLLTFLANSTMGSMDWKNALSLLGASADLPIFTGFAKTANLKLNKNKYQQLLEQYQKAGLVSIQEINDSLYNLKSDNDKLINNKKALAIQEQDYKMSQAKFNKGIISKLDLLQKREVLLYTEVLSASAKVDCFIDKISLYKATGARL